MCGINGFSGSDRLLIEKMNAVTRNRGPDDTGTYVDEKVTLGHNRLSIIDLSENGHQPMANEDETVWITYNGEVYNFEEIRQELLERGHVFRSDTDTEVIVHAYEEYGYDIVKRFNGMWAFCIYDKRKNELILSRDQFGIKPLYYYMDDGRIIFSSMIGSILCHDVKTAPNDRAIMEYLAFNLEDHDRYTFFENIYTLSPDTLLIYSLADHSHRFHRWYDLEKSARKGGDIRELFIESVKLRTIADVPIGSCLSGGVDSSAIVCVLDRILPDRFSTYSLISPGSRLDESRYIKEVGKVTRTEQHFTTIDRADVLSDLRDFIAAQEEPVTGLSPYAQYRVMKLAHDNRAKVLLDGQGGDELFAGYVYYYGYYYYELLKKLKLLTMAREMVCYRLNFKNFYPHRMLLFMLLPDSLKSVFGSRVIGKWVSLPYLKKVCGDRRDPRWEGRDLRSALILTIRKTAIPHLLRWEDKNSMRWSIETRPPFLDVNLMEAALSMAPGDNLKNGRTKAGFRQAVRDILPPAILDRKDKIGFAAPGNELFRDKDMVSVCRGIINSSDFKGRPYWDPAVVHRMFNDHVKGEIDIGDTIWKWINLELWLREYFGDRRPAEVQAEQKLPLPMKPVPLATAKLS